MVDSYNDQINSANDEADGKFEEKEKRIFYKQYKKFFKETVLHLEDIVLEQWENNEHNKTMSNAIEHIAFDIDRLTTKILPYFENNQAAEATSSVVDATQAMSLAVVESVNNLPALYNPVEQNVQGFGDGAREVFELETDYRQDMVSIFKTISADINYIADYYRLLARNKNGGVGLANDPNKPKKDDSGFFAGLGGIFSTIAGMFAFKNLRKLLAVGFGALTKKLSGSVTGLLKRLGGFILKPVALLLERFPMLGKIFSKIGGMFAPIAKFFGKNGIKAVPLIGEIVIAVMSIYDFFKGFSDAGASELLGISKDKLTIFDKLKSGVVSLVSGLMFDLIDKKTVLGFVNKFNNTVKVLWKSFYSMVPNFVKKNIINPIITAMKSVASLPQKIYSAVTEKMKSIWGSIIDGLVAGLNGAIKLATGGIFDFEDMKSIFTAVWTAVKNAITEYISSFSATELIKNIMMPTDSANFNSEPKTLDTSTSAATTELEVQKAKMMNKKQEAPTIVVPQNNQKPQASVDRAVSSGRDDMNRIIAGNKQFSFS